MHICPECLVAGASGLALLPFAWHWLKAKLRSSLWDM